MEWYVIRRQGWRRYGAAAAVGAAAVAVAVVSAPREPADAAADTGRTAAAPVADAVPARPDTHAGENAGAALAPTPRRAYMRDCARPSRARERIGMDHLFEAGCITQLSGALASLVNTSGSDEARVLLQRHRARTDSVERGDWTSGAQTDRVRQALLSATEVMAALSGAADGTDPAVRREVEAARTAALSLRPGVPLAGQSEQTDDFFRRAGEVLRLLRDGQR